MTILSTILSAITFIFRNLFGKSDAQKLGETETRLETIQRTVEVREAMRKAKKPLTDSELESTLRSGKLSLVLLVLLSACAHPTSTAACPTLKEWSPPEQSRMADELLLLPKDSMVRSAMKDYAYMRNQVRTCNTYRE